MRDGAAGLKPTHLAIVLDKSEGSFRKELYEDYKGHRPDRAGGPRRSRCRSCARRSAPSGSSRSSWQRYEADDLIATYTQQAKARGADVLIISSDKDLMQLVGPLVCFYDFESGAKGKPGYRPERNLDEAAVTEKWEGLPPEKIGDVLALMGDTSDNVPGVPGIGLKTAAQLIKEFGDLETLLARARRDQAAQAPRDPDRQRRHGAALEEARDARLRGAGAGAARRSAPCPSSTRSRLDRLPQGDGVQHPHAPRRRTLRCRSRRHRAGSAPHARRRGDPLGARRRGGRRPPTMRCRSSARPMRPRARSIPSPASTCRRPPPAQAGRGSRHALAACAASARREASSLPFDVDAYETVTSLERLKEWVAQAREQGFVAVDTETSDLDANLADLVGFSLALEPGKAAYVPLQHRGRFRSLRRRARAGPDPRRRRARRRSSPLFEDPSVLKIGQNLKYDWIVLKRHGIEVRPFDDTMLISYVLDAGKGSHGMDELSRRHLGHSPITLLRGGGHGQEQGHLRQGRDRQGDGLRGRGCGCHPAPVAAC